MACRIPGISGSPVKKGNVETFWNRAIDRLPGSKDIEKDIVPLSRLKLLIIDKNFLPAKVRIQTSFSSWSCDRARPRATFRSF